MRLVQVGRPKEDGVSFLLNPTGACCCAREELLCVRPRRDSREGNRGPLPPRRTRGWPLQPVHTTPSHTPTPSPRRPSLCHLLSCADSLCVQMHRTRSCDSRHARRLRQTGHVLSAARGLVSARADKRPSENRTAAKKGASKTVAAHTHAHTHTHVREQLAYLIRRRRHI